MPEAREKDELDHVPILLKNVSPPIPKKELELEDLIEDLTRMGSESLLAKTCNLQRGDIADIFLRERKSMV